MPTMGACGGSGVRTPLWLHPYFATALMGAGVFASSLTLRYLDPQGAARVAAALLAVPPSVFLVYTFVRWTRGLDEMHHRIVFEAVAIAFVLSILAAIAMEGLEKAGLAAGLEWDEAWAGMLILYAVGYAWAWRRYQ